MTRIKPRDIYDLWFLMSKKNVIFDINLINRKLALYGIKFNFKEFRNRIEKMRGLWETDLKHLTINDPQEFNKVKKELLEKINQRFNIK